MWTRSQTKVLDIECQPYDHPYIHTHEGYALSAHLPYACNTKLAVKTYANE